MVAANEDSDALPNRIRDLGDTGRDGTILDDRAGLQTR